MMSPGVVRPEQSLLCVTRCSSGTGAPKALISIARELSATRSILRGGGHAHRLATLRVSSMTMTPSMLSVGGRVDDSMKPLRR